MGPIFDRLKTESKDGTIRMLRLDLTDDLGVAIAKEAATEWGVSDIFSYSQRTGFIVLIDAKNLRSLDRLDISMPVDAMKVRLDAARKRVAP